MKKLLLFLFSALTALCFSQSAQLTPIFDIGTHTVSVGVPQKFASIFSAGKTLKVPTNYSVSVYHAGGLSKPRFMAFSPAGVLHVSDMNAGKVFALPDANKDGVSDTIIEAATGFTGNHDVKFYKGSMYVTEPTRIWKCNDLDLNGTYETKTIFISNIGNNQTNGHTTRTIVFDSINQKAYVSVGSSCNVCRETSRAIIERYDDNGTNRIVYSTGVRNAVGMAIQPSLNRLWANNNGSDQQGNEIPPEWIDLVRQNGFYGHPFVYGSGVWFNFNTGGYQSLLPITSADSAKVATLILPAALIRAHSAPMALEFLNAKFGTSLQNGFLTALRGSWNTTNPNDFRGYKVIFGRLSTPQDTTVDFVADFCAGFITDTVNRVFWGRPVGLATDNDGKVYISSDEGNKVILVMTPANITGLQEQETTLISAQIFPNPGKDQFTLSFALSQPATVKIEIFDLLGKTITSLSAQNLSAGSYIQDLGLRDVAAGCYITTLTAGEQTIKKKFMITE